MTGISRASPPKMRQLSDLGRTLTIFRELRPHPHYFYSRRKSWGEARQMPVNHYHQMRVWHRSCTCAFEFDPKTKRVSLLFSTNISRVCVCVCVCWCVVDPRFLFYASSMFSHTYLFRSSTPVTCTRAVFDCDRRCLELATFAETHARHAGVRGAGARGTVAPRTNASTGSRVDTEKRVSCPGSRASRASSSSTC